MTNIKKKRIKKKEKSFNWDFIFEKDNYFLKSKIDNNKYLKDFKFTEIKNMVELDYETEKSIIKFEKYKQNADMCIRLVEIVWITMMFSLLLNLTKDPLEVASYLVSVLIVYLLVYFGVTWYQNVIDETILLINLIKSEMKKTVH